MTWMPDRGSAPRGRQHSNSPRRAAHRPDWADDHGYDGAGHDTGYDGAGGHPRTAQRQLGIPHILGRRARWVGARLRRDT
ncbi:hypothetical protein ABT093_01390 [Kitasatospora sp. NPDC002551]|uniref:hypothetical protein n=1 Tax=unclassified Kitasatospora TaxID=2633591 RepID=UPI003331B362